ncbi:uncharacterized protein VTP21DRAFT_11581 [Calcarisporiella thermophila]|uniref:uncharacterized protein n=1 Tax=Calcarisporiella thermophila TaxID=911321 RepID=UPI0037442367
MKRLIDLDNDENAFQASPTERIKKENKSTTEENDFSDDKTMTNVNENLKENSSTMSPANDSNFTAEEPDITDQPTNDSTIIQHLDQSTSERDEMQENIFKNFRLRRVIRENHGQDTTRAVFFFDADHIGPHQDFEHDSRLALEKNPQDTCNIVATVGGAQVNIYDNEHCGDNLDLVSHFTLDPSENRKTQTSRKELNACCWIRKGYDGYLITAGKDTMIHILSMLTSQEVKVLSGHSKPIVDLQRVPNSKSYIMSASRDGTVRLWNIDTENCLAIYEVDASVIAIEPSGKQFFTGGFKGDIRRWDLPSLDYIPESPKVFGRLESQLVTLIGHPGNGKKPHGDSPIDCIRFAGEHIVSKSTNNRMEMWDPETFQHIRSFKVKNSIDNVCRFDISLDGKFLAVGGSNGNAYIYNLRTGKVVVELSHRRAVKAIRACAFSHDCRNVICTTQGATVLRYDYVPAETLEKWDKWQEKNAKRLAKQRNKNAKNSGGSNSNKRARIRK